MKFNALYFADCHHMRVCECPRVYASSMQKQKRIEIESHFCVLNYMSYKLPSNEIIGYVVLHDINFYLLFEGQGFKLSMFHQFLCDYLATMTDRINMTIAMK